MCFLRKTAPYSLPAETTKNVAAVLLNSIGVEDTSSVQMSKGKDPMFLQRLADFSTSFQTNFSETHAKIQHALAEGNCDPSKHKAKRHNLLHALQLRNDGSKSATCRNLISPSFEDLEFDGMKCFLVVQLVI